MAGYIPPSFVDELLTRVDIVEVIDSRVPLKKAGKSYLACCPFHSEKTPSFNVSPQKQLYHCFGCGAGGSVIRFLMDYDNLEFPEAVEELAKMAGVDVPYEKSRSKQAPEVKVKTSDYDLLEKIANYYQYQLRQHANKQSAVDYLKRRSITGKLAKRFELGFAPPGWNNVLNVFGVNEADQKRLVELGMLIRGEGGKLYDRFRNRIMFPIRDRRGRVVAFGGRVIDAGGNPKYLNSPETPVFQKSWILYGLYQVLRNIPVNPQVIVVEGYMDVVSLAQAGVENAVATLGTAVSEQHIQTLSRHFDEVIYCFDGDEAGVKAARRALEVSLPQLNSGVAFRFMFLPQGEDPDSIVRQGGQAAFRALIDAAQPLSRFMLDEWLKTADYQGLDGQARLLETAMPFLQKIPAGSFQQLVVHELSKYVDLEPEKLLGRLGGKQSSAASGRKSTARLVAPDEKFTPLRLAIALLLEQPKLAELVPEPEKLLELNASGVKFLVELLVFIKSNPNINTATILEHWHDTEYGEHLYKMMELTRHIPETGFETEFLGSIQRLEQQILEQELNELLQRSRHDTLSQSEKQRMNDLLSLFQRLAR